MIQLPDFSLLSPQDVADATESVLGVRTDGELAAYPSYINRVYALKTEDGRRVAAKFYRPGRWSEAALREEADFVADCAAAGLPVVPPIPDADGETLHAFVAEEPGGGSERTYYFSVFPFLRGRGWEPRTEEDWTALGRLVASLHRVGERKSAPARPILGPESSAKPALERLLSERVLHPEMVDEFGDLCAETLELIQPLFEGIRLIRVHGDLHRGNLLESGDPPGPVLIDFDDAALGPAVQDLWLFLPGRLIESRRELNLLLEGYREIRPFDRRETALIEPLRFMRMLCYLDWQARQREDDGFRRAFPDWGGRAFWLKELEDLRDQARVIAEEEPEDGPALP